MIVNYHMYITSFIILAVITLLAVGVGSALRFFIMDGGPARRSTAYIISFIYFFIALVFAMPLLRIYLFRLLLGEHGISPSSLSVIDASYAFISSFLLFRRLTKLSPAAKREAITTQRIDFSEDDDAYYQEALTEISERRTFGALWARALVDAKGNTDLASSKYIEWRVQNLKEQNAKNDINPESNDDGEGADSEDGTSNKLLVLVIAILLTLVILVGIYGYGLLVEHDRSKLNDYLESSVSEFKSRGPVMIDSRTQLFAVQRTSRDELTLSFRLPDVFVYDQSDYENFLRVKLAREKCEDLKEIILLGAKFAFFYYSGDVVIARLRLDEKVCKRVPLKLSDPAASVHIR